MDAYQTLLNISVEHGFYTDGACSCLNFYPTNKTLRIFKNAGLLLKKESNGIQIIYDQARLEALQLYAEDPEDPLCFEFKVYSSDPEFMSYTEPVTDMTEGILYFDNRATTTGVGKINLSVTEYVSESDLKKLDSTALDDIISQKDRLLPPVLVVKIFAKSEQGCLLEQWLKPTSTNYSITFKARQTFWKYYLLGKLAKESSYIIDPDNQVEFESLGETSLSDQRVAFAFRSKHSIPLNEHYTFRFQLKEKGPVGENVLINRLPVACIANTGKDVLAEQGTVVSEIYINS